MCTIAVIVDVVERSRIVIAANRDELYARDALPPRKFAEGIVGGVDVLSGGTWLAVRRDGAFAAVTNQRALAPQLAGVRSRGSIVKDLAASTEMDAYVAAIDPTHYASMNLVWAPPDERPRVAYLRTDGTREVVQLTRGVHVLCNDRLGSNGFPRGERLLAAIEAIGDRPRETVLAALPALLADHTHVTPDGDDHLTRELARALTACCIHAGGYGTRSASIIAIGQETEAYLHADGPPCVTPFRDYTELL